MLLCRNGSFSDEVRPLEQKGFVPLIYSVNIHNVTVLDKHSLIEQA